jgi:alkylation response protein AidB-like acyl-CoA dehydrogenase
MLEERLASKEILDFRASVRSFVESKIAPHALEWEQKRCAPRADVLRDMAQRGLLCLSIPKELGGHGKGVLYEVVLAEELVRSRALGWALSVLVQSNVVPHILADFGTEDQQAVITRAVRGEGYTALAVTERSCGSDLLRAKTTAKREGDAYLLNGEKRWITNGSIASDLLVVARTSDSDGPWSQSLFLVPGDAKGLRRERLRTTGFKTSDTAVLTLDSVRVSKEALVGTEGKAFMYLLKGLQRERLLGGVAVVSVADRALETVKQELAVRERFGTSLIEKQAIRHRLADLDSAVTVVRAFAYQTVEKHLNGLPIDRDVAMLKLHVYNTVQEVVRECAQLLGAEAFVEDHWLAHATQDVQAITVAAGTAEIMRELVAAMDRVKPQEG